MVVTKKSHIINKPAAESWLGWEASSSADFLLLITKPKLWRRKMSASLLIRISCNVFAIRGMSPKGFVKMLVLALAQRTGTETRKDCPTKEIWRISSNPCEAAQKNNHLLSLFCLESCFLVGGISRFLLVGGTFHFEML